MPTSDSGSMCLPEMSLASWGHLPGGSVLWDFLGVRGSCWSRQGSAQGQPVLTGLLDLRVTAPHRGVPWRSMGGGMRGRVHSGSIHLPQDLLPCALGVEWCWA